jgi:hypothetical protein
MRRLDALAGELNGCLIVAAIGLACVDLVGYAALFSQSHAMTVAAAAWSRPIDAVDTAPIIRVDAFGR